MKNATVLNIFHKKVNMKILAIALSAILLATLFSPLLFTPEEETQYFAFRYQWVVYISEGRVVAGPEKFGITKGKNIKLLAAKLPLREEDKPTFATHQTDKLVMVPIFSNFTPITKEQFEIATKSKAISINLE